MRLILFSILIFGVNSTFDFEWQGNEQFPTNYYNYQQQGQTYQPYYYFQNNNYDQFNRQYYSNFGQNQWNQQWLSAQRPLYFGNQYRPIDYRQQFVQQRPAFNPHRRFPINDHQFISNSNQQAKIQVPTTTPVLNQGEIQIENEDRLKTSPTLDDHHSQNQTPDEKSHINTQNSQSTVQNHQTEVQPSQVENEEEEATGGFGENSALTNEKPE